MTEKQDIQTLQERVNYLEGRLAQVENFLSAQHAAGKQVAQPVPVREEPQGPEPEVPKKEARFNKESSQSFEVIGFKAFGAIGLLLVLLGLLYFYRFAVDQGWIGILGRVALGVLFSLAMIAGGSVLNRKGYDRYSTMLMGGGIALLYFTIYATYHFPHYREELGMGLIFNTVLLFGVVVLGSLLALRLNAREMAFAVFSLGYLASFLSGVGGAENTMMISVLALSAGVLIVLSKRDWHLNLFPILASYFLYAVYFNELDLGRVTRGSLPPDFFYAFLYLTALFILFVGLSLTRDGQEQMVVAVINGAALLGFGLPLIWDALPDLRAIYVLFLALVHLGLATLARNRSLSRVFATMLTVAITLLTIIPPIQLDGAWVTLAWAVEGLLLIIISERVDAPALKLLGVAVIFLSGARALLFDSWAEDYPWRTVAFIAGIVGLGGGAGLLHGQRRDEKGSLSYLSYLLAMGATVLLIVALAVEILDSGGLFGGLSRNARQVFLSIAWAGLSVALIGAGFNYRARAVRLLGILVFGLTIIKVLTFDLGGLPNIFRVAATMIVGIIALGLSFLYIKNKERFQEMIQSDGKE